MAKHNRAYKPEDILFPEQAITELVCKYGAAMKKVASNILNDPQDVEECLKAFLRKP